MVLGWNSMAIRSQQDITGMLAAWSAGDTHALDRLIDVVYPELRQIAHRNLSSRRPGESLESGALANEAYLKLVRAGGIRCDNRLHFLALCAQIMRRILVDHARRRGFAKRGGSAVRVPLDEVLLVVQARSVEVLALDEALDALARFDRRKSRIVELRYFGGLTIEEAAEVLSVSADTAKRDWRMARAWLIGVLSGKRDSDQSYGAMREHAYSTE
jgi:RNA polymerase sigma factor (TIGR02999 family)